MAKSAARRRRTQGRAQASQTACQTSVPVSSIAGRPSRQPSSRASSRCCELGDSSRVGAQSVGAVEPGPRKEGLRPHAFCSRKRDLRRPTVEGRKPGPRQARSIGCHQPSPVGSEAEHDLQIEREMSEDVAHGADCVAVLNGGIRPFAYPAARPYRRACPSAGRRTSQTLAIALDPIGAPYLCGR